MKAAAVGLAAAGALALPGVVGAGGGAHCQNQEITTSKGTTSAIELGCYAPTVLYVGTGGEVTWTNRDAVPHTVTGLFGSWGNYEQFELNESMTFTFDEAGVFPYFCVVHPSMQGVVVVGDGIAGASPDVATIVEPTPAPAAAVSSAGGAILEAPATSSAASSSGAALAAAAGVGGIALGALGMGWVPRSLRRR